MSEIIMTSTVVLVFTQPNCPPCYRLKDYINTLPSEQQDAIEFVPFKTPSGEITALADELNIKQTPTLVVAAESLVCEEADEEGYRACDIKDETVETIVGATNITTALPGVLTNYIFSEE